MLAKDACEEKAGGLAGGEKREGCSREWVECDASQGSADGRSIVTSFGYLGLNSKDTKCDRSDYCCCLVHCTGPRAKRWLACGAIATGIDDAARRKSRYGGQFFLRCL